MAESLRMMLEMLGILKVLKALKMLTMLMLVTLVTMLLELKRSLELRKPMGFGQSVAKQAEQAGPRRVLLV